ncbi:MAG TPA: DUF2849 domain-containing protein [Rhizomicrobium sp.]|nr:DUF2849 domain-containing protein [Rhizomicrobium sp.]
MSQADQILTANRLRDGEVVYWSRGQWVTALDAAEVFQDDATAKAALKGADASVQDRTVVNPYLFEVRVEAGVLRPVKEREIIRAAGPSVRLDLGKQSTEAFDVSL